MHPDPTAHQRALQVRNLMHDNAAPTAPATNPPIPTAPPVPSTPKSPTTNPPVGPVPSWPNTYYDNSTSKFWKLSPKGLWVSLNGSALRDHLIVDGYDAFPRKGDALSEVDRVIVKIQQEQMVHFTGNLAGYGKGLCVQGDTRILVTGEPTFISPIARNWDMLRGLFERMFGTEQLPYVYGWIKVALKMFHARTWMAGQVLVLCGERESGKNLFATLLQHLFGGRMPGKPFGYMTKATDFNSDIIGCELLTIEDEASLVGIQARRAFGASIKDFAVNATRRLHRKHVEALTVIVFQRLVISVNDDPERLQVLPAIELDIEDKIMLTKVTKGDMPMPTTTPEERKAFEDALLSQLPAFVHFLDTWEIPRELVSNRFGIRHFHHPDVLDALQELSPEERLMQLIDEVVFNGRGGADDWHGKAVELDRRLKGSEVKHVEREAKELLPAGNSCGKYLGRLATRYPNRVIKHPASAGIHRWTITAPEDDGAEAVPSVRTLSPAAQFKLLEMVRARANSPSLGEPAATPEAQSESVEEQASTTEAKE